MIPIDYMFSIIVIIIHSFHDFDTLSAASFTVFYALRVRCLFLSFLLKTIW